MKAPITTIKLPKFNRTRTAENLEPFFDVRMEPLIRRDGVETNKVDLVNDITNKSLGTVSKTYKVTTHEAASSLVKDFLASSGLEYESLGAQVSNGGSRFFETIIFPGMAFNPAKNLSSTAFDIDNPSKDFLIPAIVTRNSYDRTSPVAFDYNFYRPICTNGMSILESSERLSFRHSQILDSDMVRERLIANLSASVKAMTENFMRLNRTEGSEALIALFKSKFSDSFKQSVIEHLQKIDPTFAIKLDEEIDPENGHRTLRIKELMTKASAYAIYNVATDITTHEISNRSVRESTGKAVAEVFAITG